MRYRHLLAIAVILGGCQSHPDTGDLYVYTDAQGNLVTLQKPARHARQASQSEEAPASSSDESATAPQAKSPQNAPLGSDSMADYRPSDEVEADLKDKERDRFVTYMDATGQLVNRPVDLVAAKEAKENAGPGYQTVAQDQYLETYRAIRSDCCKHLIDDAIALHLNRQRSIHFDDETALMVGDEPYRAVLLAPDEGVSAIDVRAYLKNKGYVAAQILWLDSSGTPVLLVDQPFTRRYEENWYRYGYLEGTLPRQQGQTYLVVFLPYTQDHPSTDGLTATLSGDLVVTGVATANIEEQQ